MKKRIPLVGLVVVSVLLSACADLFQDKVALNRGASDSGALQDLFKPGSTEPVKLSAPSQLYVADARSPSRIKLGWNTVEGASSYVVERAVTEPLPDGGFPPEPGEGDFEVLDSFVSAPAYTDVILSDPRQDAREYRNRYYYRVRAENIGNGLDPGPPSALGMGTLFAPPRNVRAGKGASKTEVRVDWDKVKGAAAYRVYRSDYATGAAPLAVGKVPGNQNWYRDSGVEKNRDYYYSVEALTPAQTPGLAGPLALGYALAENAPGKTAVRLAAGYGRGHHTDRIRIEWDPDPAIPAADVSYAVYRYSSEDSSLTPLSPGVNAAFWEDTVALEPGIFYYYQVQPIGKAQGGTPPLKGPFSDPLEAFILSPPATALAEKSGAVVSVKWYPVIGTPAEQQGWSYKVYGSGSLGGVFTELKVIPAPAPVGSDGYIHADGVGNYSVYRFYRVSTLNRTSVESQPGAAVSPYPAAALIQQVSRAAFIAGQTPNSSGVYPVSVSWKKPENEAPASYHVYRSPEPDSGFRRITVNPVPGVTGNTFTFVDPNGSARAGRWYYYRVLSLNELGQGSSWSDTLAGYGALDSERYMLEYNKTILASQKKLTLMHKPNNLDKLGSETSYGTISGSISYEARVESPGARIIMRYEGYADFFIGGDSTRGAYFSVTGNTNTTTSISGNGKMDGTMECTGMYPGKVYYDNVEIKGGAAGGGTYGIEPEGFPREEVSWLVGEVR
ncbi:MAG: hypothetical protein LBQ38_05960 [Spirochaetaceae bacterium]|nr:hypothetical protein [Spirochaetaceae bacterium]